MGKDAERLLLKEWQGAVPKSKLVPWLCGWECSWFLGQQTNRTEHTTGPTEHSTERNADRERAQSLAGNWADSRRRMYTTAAVREERAGGGQAGTQAAKLSVPSASAPRPLPSSHGGYLV